MPDFSFEGLILKPLLSWCMGGLGFVYTLLLKATAGFFSIDIIGQVLAFFQWLSWCMFTLGILFALIDYAIDFVDGNNPNAITLFKNLGKGLLVTMFAQKAMLLIFDIARFFTETLFKLDATNGINQGSITASLGIDAGAMLLMLIVIVIFFIIIIIMIFFQFLERNGMILLHLILVNFYIISICRGYHEPFSVWIRQGIALSFTQSIQTLCVIVAFCFFGNSAYFILGIGMILAASKVDKVMQQFSFSSGSRNNAKTAVNASMTAIRMLTVKG